MPPAVGPQAPRGHLLRWLGGEGRRRTARRRGIPSPSEELDRISDLSRKPRITEFAQKAKRTGRDDVPAQPTIKIALLTARALALTALLRRRSAAMRHWVLATRSSAVSAYRRGTAFAGMVDSPSRCLVHIVGQSSLRLVSEWCARQVRGGARDGRDESPDRVAFPRSDRRRIWLGGVASGCDPRSRVFCDFARSLLNRIWSPRAHGRRFADSRSRYGSAHVRLLRCRHPTMLATWGSWADHSPACRRRDLDRRSRSTQCSTTSWRTFSVATGSSRCGKRAQGGLLVQPAALARVPPTATRR